MRTRLGPSPTSEALAQRLAAARALTEALVAPMSDADATVQSMDDASPAKWHLAHTTWFFETFVLRDFVPDYRLHDERFPFLFNSYYEAEGRRHARGRRGMVTRGRGSTRCWRTALMSMPRSPMPCPICRKKRARWSGWGATTKSSTRNCC